MAAVVISDSGVCRYAVASATILDQSTRCDSLSVSPPTLQLVNRISPRKGGHFTVDRGSPLMDNVNTPAPLPSAPNRQINGNNFPSLEIGDGWFGPSHGTGHYAGHLFGKGKSYLGYARC